MRPFLVLLSLLLVVAGTAPLKAQSTDSIPAHQSFTIQSRNVGELRTINIWIPPEYDTHSAPLPVLYMLDGGLQEDFPHLAHTLGQLIRDKKIKPHLLVGIENTQRRRDLTGATKVASDKRIAPVVGGAEPFRAFIKEELFPEIARRYTISAQRGIIGESLAGLFIIETFFIDPDMFDQYIAFDPSLWWNHHYWIKRVLQHKVAFPRHPKQLWFAGSHTKGISEFTRKLNRMLHKGQYPGIRWNYADEPGETHATIFRATKVKALIWSLQ